jgi:tetratricopeptide (TPR) repeat protein
MNTDMKAKGPGQGGPGQRGGGFSFGDDRGGGGGRGGDRDGRRGGGGRDKREGGGGASYRVINELSAVEKALTKADFAAMKQPLSEVLKALRSLRLQSLSHLDLNARGKLITSLMRVMRLPRPKDAEPVEAAPVEAAPVEAPPVEAAPVESASVEGVTADAAPAESAPTDAAAAPAAPPAVAPPAVADPAQQWRDTQFTIGLIWRSVNDADRAQAAFENAGRQPSEADVAIPAGEPAQAKPARGERPERGARKERGGERGEPRRPVVERAPRLERPEPFTPTGDWQADAAKLEQLGRTRDAGRLHEKNKSFVDAVRLYQGGSDLKAALRCAALGKLDAELAALSAKLKPEEVIEALERAEAWEKLMELHVARQDFESIAKLYERALQFDQAALAWERAQKYALARKAYERAKDFPAANRMRELEVAKLIERGDRLGAATLLMTVGRKAEAMEALKQLPGPKAFSFMQKLKLGAEATAFGKEELAKAEAASNGLQRARWLELLGDPKAAVEAYLAISRKDKAALVLADQGDWKQAAELMEAAAQLDKASEFFTKAGDATNAERVKALPRAAPAAAPAVSDEGEAAPAEAELVAAPAEVSTPPDVQNLA